MSTCVNYSSSNVSSSRAGIYFLRGCRQPDPKVPITQRFLRWLRYRVSCYFAERNEYRIPNYENIYFLASQLADDRTELQNPALSPFLDLARREIVQWPEYADWTFQRVPIRSPAPLRKVHELADEACHLIVDVVQRVLSKDPRNPACPHLKLLVDIQNERRLQMMGIATLAHDTHAETFLEREFLKRNDIGLYDGFRADPDNLPELRRWCNRFEDTECIPFLKLHGSVSWHHKWQGGNGGYAYSKPYLATGYLETSNEAPSIQPDSRPLLLVGTFNKPTRYAKDLMIDIHYRFRRVLERSNVLVICGYSFGDKAINNHIIFSQVPERRIVVIDPRPREEVMNSARYAAAEILERSRAIFIQRGIQDVTLDCLKQHLH